MDTTPLGEYINQLRNARFKFGEHDCFLFAAGAVKVVCNTDLTQGVEAYNSEVSAVIVLRRMWGTSNLLDVFNKIVADNGAVEVPSEDAADGDICVIKWPARMYRFNEIDQNYGLGVCYRGEMWAATPRGVRPVGGQLPILSVWRFPKCQ